MSERDERRADDLHALDELVRIQQRMVRRWSNYAVEYVGRLQSGNLDPSTWLDAYGRIATETADDFLESMQALSKLRGMP